MTLERALRFVAIAGIFCLPFIVLIVSKSLFFPFITGKNFAFRILVEIVGVAWLALALVYPQYRPKRTWVLAAFAAFVVAIGVADAFGVYPFKSFWSNYERMEGWITLAHLFVYFLAASSLLTADLWKRWWQTSLGVSILVGLYGLIQLAGLATINQGGVRLDATLGNATYLAVYMLFHVFIAGVLLADEWSRRPKERVMFAILYGGAITLNLVILFFTATRGAVLGLLGGAFLAAFIFLARSPRSPAAWRLWAGIAALGVVVLGLWFARDSAFIKQNETLSRLTSMSFSETTVAARFVNWHMAWQGVKERPILGWGQENYAAVFDKYYDPRMYAQEPWFDRVHQLVLDWLIAGGIVGLLSYLSIWAASLIALWRSKNFSDADKSIVTGLLAGYFFYLLFTFDNIVSYLLFVSLVAYITVRGVERAEPIVAAAPLSPRALPFVAGVAVLLAWGVAWGVNAHALSANRAIIQGLSPQTELSKNLEYFKTAIALRTMGTQEAREHLTQSAMRVVSLNVPPEVKSAFVNTAASELAEQNRDAPLNARFPFFLGALLNGSGNLAEAKIALEKAHELSPGKQTILFELASNAFARGDSSAAMDMLKKAYTLEPKNNDALIYYAVGAARAGDTTLENELFPEVVSRSLALEQRLLAGFATGKHFAALARLLERHVAARPDDMQAKLTLAVAVFGSGNPTRAITLLQNARAAHPNISAEVDSLIQQIQNGTLRVE